MEADYLRVGHIPSALWAVSDMVKGIHFPPVGKVDMDLHDYLLYRVFFETCSVFIIFYNHNNNVLSITTGIQFL